MESDMPLSGSTGWDFTEASGGGTGYSRQAIPVHSFTSSFLFITLSSLLVLSYPSTTYMFIVVTTVAGGPCGWEASG